MDPWGSNHQNGNQQRGAAAPILGASSVGCDFGSSSFLCVSLNRSSYYFFALLLTSFSPLSPAVTKHINFTKISQRTHKGLTKVSQIFHTELTKELTKNSQRTHKDFTMISQRTHKELSNISQRSPAASRPPASTC